MCNFANSANASDLIMKAYKQFAHPRKFKLKALLVHATCGTVNMMNCSKIYMNCVKFANDFNAPNLQLL